MVPNGYLAEIASSDFFFRKFIRWKMIGLALRSPTGETFSHDHSPNESGVPGRTEMYNHFTYHSTLR